MVGALVLWIFGGDYIDAAMVGYSVVALMLLLRIICWDDIVSNKAAWNVFFWLASLITLATGLNNTGFISWFGKLLAGSLNGYSPTMVMVALIVVFYLLRYFFASATAYTSASRVLPDGWRGNWSGEHSYAIRHRTQSDLLR